MLTLQQRTIVTSLWQIFGRRNNEYLLGDRKKERNEKGRKEGRKEGSRTDRQTIRKKEIEQQRKESNIRNTWCIPVIMVLP